MSIVPSRSVLERHWISFVVLGLIVRGLSAVLMLNGTARTDVSDRLPMVNDDTASYLAPIESILSGGNYEPDYRMPGVGAPYWILRQFLDVEDSLYTMVILQVLISGVCVWLLGLLAERMSGSTKLGLIVYGLFLISTHTSRYDIALASDSLTISVVIIQATILQRAFDRRSTSLLVLAGLLLTWLYFLRPVASLLIAPASLLILFRWSGRPSLRPVLWFLIPVAIFETAWVVRNWKANHEFNPLTNQGMMPDWISKSTRGHVMDFVRGYGGNYIWWEPGADIRWYGEWMSEAAVDDEGRKATEPPPDAYVPGYDRDSLLLISERVRQIHAGGLSPQDSTATTEWVKSTLIRYGRMHREAAPFSHHILSRARMLRYILAQSGCEFLFDLPFDQLPLWKKGFKLIQVALFAFAMIAGAVFAANSLWHWRHARTVLALWVPIVAIYMIVVYPLVLKMSEHRWVAHVYPLWLLMGVMAVAAVLGRVRRGSEPATRQGA